MGPKTIAETRTGRALADPMIFLNMTGVMRRVDPEQAAPVSYTHLRRTGPHTKVWFAFCIPRPRAAAHIFPHGLPFSRAGATGKRGNRFMAHRKPGKADGRSHALRRHDNSVG